MTQGFIYRLAADGVLVVHFLFVLFVVFGGGLLFWRKWTAWLHLPAVLWGAGIEFTGWICPLTPLENRFRELSGTEGYATGFVEHYITAMLYPAGLTRDLQFLLGCLAMAVNIALYGWAWRHYRKRESAKGRPDNRDRENMRNIPRNIQ